MFSPLEQFDIISILCFGSWLAYDLSLPNILLPFLIIVFVLIVSYKNIYITIHRVLPKTVIQQLGEMVIVFIFNILKSNIGPKAYTNVVLWTTTFLIVLLGNLLALIPFGIAMTSHIL
jgi:F0F1-type ATP synthase membrane subunit a